MQPVSSISGLAHQAAGWLEVLNAESWAVMFDLNGKPVVRAAHQLERMRPLLRPLSEKARAQGRPRWFERVELENPEWRGSALMIPLMHERLGCLGILAAYHGEPGRFSFADAERLFLLARGLTQQLPQADTGQPAAVQSVHQNSPPPWRLMMAPLVVLVLGGGWLMLRPAAAAWVLPTPARPTPLPDQGPLVASRAFLAELEKGDQSRLRSHLSQGFQRRLPQQRLRQLWQAWNARPDQRWQVRQRTAVLVRQGGSSAEVALMPAATLGQRDPEWRWHWVREGARWKLDRVERGPLAPAP